MSYYYFDPPHSMNERYLENSGMSCPYCGRDDLESYTKGRNDEAIVTCGSCGKSWLEYLLLGGILLDKDLKQDPLEPQDDCSHTA